MSTITQKTVQQRSKLKKKKPVALVSPTGSSDSCRPCLFDDDRPLLLESLLEHHTIIEEVGGDEQHRPGYKLVERIPSIISGVDNETVSSSFGLSRKKDNQQRRPGNKDAFLSSPPSCLKGKTHTRKMTEDTVLTEASSFDSIVEYEGGYRHKQHREAIEAVPRQRVTFRYPIVSGPGSPLAKGPEPPPLAKATNSPQYLAQIVGAGLVRGSKHASHTISCKKNKKDCGTSLPPFYRENADLELQVQNRCHTPLDYPERNFHDSLVPCNQQSKVKSGHTSLEEKNTLTQTTTIPHLLSFDDDEEGHCHENCGFIRKRTTTIHSLHLPVTPSPQKNVEDEGVGMSAEIVLQERRKLIRRHTSDSSLVGLQFLDDI
uniref:Uncharacterized protein n=1 Tax=Corethron hystrix TaxID=216773 RepID=A0A7S1FYU3_9STRA|eukprot:CAMPEP_0113317734 /NCGR_PEP_ID=MMETSP0010_2-20120614/12522_1 /TAXON_ID=216773 ORGANISM="Corethron hystrix, Strain 308" /NCGR_SAMPLE_ID=MMETSP0010_2 /ASSEMBLY_ACC=CAM_ASM_000155 /LENGTH=373 /DNA_ID=CAMNT_0000174771 /DNA_START=18 /DNA_END=1139 /DNA_ORIENTATION=+ /assembly_acc=CAM_ASM_000155